LLALCVRVFWLTVFSLSLVCGVAIVLLWRPFGIDVDIDILLLVALALFLSLACVAAVDGNYSQLVVPSVVTAGNQFNMTIRAYSSGGLAIPYGGLRVTQQLSPSSATTLTDGGWIDNGNGNYTRQVSFWRVGSIFMNASLVSSVYNTTVAVQNGSTVIVNITNGIYAVVSYRSIAVYVCACVLCIYLSLMLSAFLSPFGCIYLFCCSCACCLHKRDQ
jgi:hypothetical protein